jgi:hypothetical protein
MPRALPAALASLVVTSLLPACGGDAPPPATPAITFTPPPAPEALPAPPPLLAVPRAEASPRHRPEPKDPAVTKLRSEGKHHALERTVDGIVVLSDERGVLGFLKSPGPEIRWAGFVDDDAVLVLAGNTLHRAATPDEAIEGKLAKLGDIDPAATLIASAGKIAVAAVPAAGGAFYVSRDGGKRFSSEKRPAPGPIAEVAVRGDGLVVAAIEKEPITAEGGHKGLRTEIFVGRDARAWQKGPLADALWGPALAQHGDHVSIHSPKKKGPPGESEQLGLDAKGRWIKTDYPGNWLWFTWTDNRVEVEVPTERPGYATAASSDGGVLGGLGMLGSRGSDVHGVACLAHRSLVAAPPRVRAFHDGVCAKEHIQKRTETIHVMGGFGAKEHDEESTYSICDPSAPPRRTSTLLLRNTDAPRLVKLPVACADGHIVGTDRAAFLQCTNKHQGRASLHLVAPSGALAELVASLPADASFHGAESASDGTTLLFDKHAAWLCGPGAPACAPIPAHDFLAARPVPGGRALVARKGGGDHDLILELIGEPGAMPVRVSVPRNLLEMEITSEGHVRLWASLSRTWLQADALSRADRPSGLEAFLVRADGQLVPDPEAR